MSLTCLARWSVATLFPVLLHAVPTESTAGEAFRISDQTAPFVYEVKAEIPTPKEALAKILSTDYRNAPDEFTAHELYEKVEPIVDKRIAEARAAKRLYLVIGDRLPQYDFKAKGFPTGLSETTFIPYDNGYAVMLTNAAAFSLLPVDMADAKRLSGVLQRNRSASLNVEGQVVTSKEQELNYQTRKVIMLEITRLTVQMQDGTVVGIKQK